MCLKADAQGVLYRLAVFVVPACRVRCTRRGGSPFRLKAVQRTAWAELSTRKLVRESHFIEALRANRSCGHPATARVCLLLPRKVNTGGNYAQSFHVRDGGDCRCPAALLLFVGSRYHVVRANDGFHLIPRSSARLTEPYVDIRQFTIEDWDEHQGLAILGTVLRPRAEQAQEAGLFFAVPRLRFGQVLCQRQEWGCCRSRSRKVSGNWPLGLNSCESGCPNILL